jgi:glycosyltransferase involved in cell wall biosynthesis
MANASLEILTPQEVKSSFKNANSAHELPAELAVPRVAVLTGGQDRHYAYGLTTALIDQGLRLDVLGNDSVDGPEMHSAAGLKFLYIYGHKPKRGFFAKIRNLVTTYLRLSGYALKSEAKVFHILWNYRIEAFDRTFLMLYFRLLGKKVALTAHNVNTARRDATDSVFNRLTLRMQYRLCHKIFVHTEKMKHELLEQLGVQNTKITVIPYGINNAVPNTQLTRPEARERLGIRENEKALLFFGAIKPYKGLEYLVAAFQSLADRDTTYRLIIAGERKKESEKYLSEIRQMIVRHPSRSRVLQQIKFIPDDEAELYFKAADVAVLPYTEIFQSGVLFLAYSFGLPAICTKVGSFADEIIEGETGFLCEPRDTQSLIAAITKYFESELYRQSPRRTEQIQSRAYANHSWEKVGQITRNVYTDLL